MFVTEDWADNESVTTDEEEKTDPPSKKKKNIHARRWTLVSKEDGSFEIEGGRRPKEVYVPRRGSELFEEQKHLVDADFVLPRLRLHRSPGRNGHVSPGVCQWGYISRTLETMRDEFLHYQNLWLESSVCISLRGTISSLKREQSYVPVDNIVCLALGSLQNTKEVCRAASLTQLAALMTVIEELDLDPPTMPGNFVAQEPAFTPLDAEFLTSLGFIVKADPEGFLAITTSTLVFSIGGYLDMDWVISRGPWPAALICDDVEEFMRGNEEYARTAEEFVVCLTKTEQEEIAEMLGGCEMVRLVGEGEGVGVGGDWIGSQRMYWRTKV